MNRELLELSYALRKKRQRKIISLVVFVLSLFASVFLMRTFLIFTVREKSVSMMNDIPSGAHLLLTPIVGTPDRGDVLLIKRLDDWDGNKQTVIGSSLDEISRFVTAQQLSTADIKGFMGQHAMLRRVAALPGDTIYMRGNVLFIKPKGEEYFLTEFERTKAPYNAAITALPAGWDMNMGIRADMEEITLGHDEYFLLGDNRVNSYDCRMWGPITLKDVSAKALVVFFPFNKFRLL